MTTTTPHLTLIRLHGRNQAGWQAGGKDWRGKRTLYRYSASELTDLAQAIQEQQPQPKETCVIFNNNSGAMRPTTPSPSAGKWIYTLRA